MEIQVIAHIHNDFKEKFGIPRQSGITENLVSEIVFTPQYRSSDAIRGLDGYSHIWVIWQFSENIRNVYSPTVRPPRLGGNKKMGVFATRSPFRPNPLGLSSLKLLGIRRDKNLGAVLLVSGADLLDGTPIYDIKPYLKYTDSHPDAIGGFADDCLDYKLSVDFPAEMAENFDEGTLRDLRTILENDPRPSYQNDASRDYAMRFGNFDIHFKVCEKLLTVTKITRN